MRGTNRGMRTPILNSPEDAGGPRGKQADAGLFGLPVPESAPRDGVSLSTDPQLPYSGSILKGAIEAG